MAFQQLSPDRHLDCRECKLVRRHHSCFHGWDIKQTLHLLSALTVSVVYIQSDNPRACRAWITYVSTWNTFFKFFKAIALQSSSPPRCSPFCPFVCRSVSSITQKLHTRFPQNVDRGWVSEQNRPHLLLLIKGRILLIFSGNNTWI